MLKSRLYKRLGRRDRVFSRLMICFLITAALGLPVDVLSQTITFSGKQVPLQQAFTEIKKQANYAVIFNPELINVNVAISVNAKKQPLEVFMKSILAKQPLSYTIVGTTIVVFPRVDNMPDSVKFTLEPVVHDISGLVYDEKTGAPVIGASVIVNGSAKGTQTDEKGSFVLRKLKDNEQLTITCIGFEKVNVTVPIGQSLLYVTMKTATSVLDQAVVQAYGITSKRLATGNISRVTAEEIERQPVMNPLLALQGRVPGLLVTQTSGYAASPVKVEIRGRNSLNPDMLSDPLYVIDGVPLTVLDVSGSVRYEGGASPGYIQGGLSVTGGQSPLFSMNPRDIASIEVLKDADATAIYGSRAANGVILITTKKGKPGKTTFNMEVNQGIIDVPKRYQMLNTPQYLQMRREAFRNDGIIPTLTTAPDLVLWDSTRYTDWQKVLLGTGKQSAVVTSLTGGDNLAMYRISANYARQEDVVKNSGLNQQASITSSVDVRSVNQKFSLGLTLGYSYTNVDAVFANASVITLAPNAPPVYDSKGELNYAEWNAAGIGGQFPFADLLRTNNAQTNQFSSSMRMGYELARGLKFVTTGGYSYMMGANNYLMPIASQNPIGNPTGSAVFGTSKNSNLTVEPQLTYSRFIGRGDLSVLVGGTYQSTMTNGTTTFAAGYGDDDLIHTVGSAPFSQTSEGYSKYKYIGFLARINYDWEHKYILNMTARRDGSSRFAPGRQFGNFGSAAVAWNFSEEKWIKRFLPSWVTFMKLRVSYGIVGGNAPSDYQYLSQWAAIAPGDIAPLPGYNGVQPFVPIHAVNQDYHWETNKKFEAGFSASFLEERISVEVSTYRNRSGDQITGLPTPAYTGFKSVTGNWPALIQNSGWEGMISATLIRKKDIMWNVNFNIATNRNLLVSYPGIELSPYFTRYKVGQSLNAEYLLHYQGIDPQTGGYSFLDYNKDGLAKYNYNIPAGTGDDDRYIAINRTPKYFGGIGSTVNYKGLSVNLLFDFKKQLGQDPFITNVKGQMNNFPVEALRDHWQKPGDNARYARYSTYFVGDINASDAGVTDASYLRLRSVAIGYSFSDKLSKKAGLKGCTLSFRLQNIFTISNYPGLDPEIQNYSAVPAGRTFSGALSFTL
ncbi:SusC/RagA family TonB-linked outer membrane protein [Chitinophaga ginsengisegetis]|uniref:SusC/RagA family TonB-linked outer membrane protein n=1 Tax=Chitinophaga ginsengisegetis TaxID=393003 RepID=UPI000DBA830F|nr:SusC/RagA family TonB-linked outer membrane protein [Chitinophaga ginsengisegetis]MDR6570771.1 TonB-linked SusC/RagA family outer membrane protein [Chitinophaga ginsengisegetis]MDR6650505.1 TonB-linked SusC/RagA family outer membrane protein [Chitinophaga ginsengisegetis]MDR6656856.1 TonB-linked SusC/RagA family outer membrane protein [Chitinophaga ginsengisegetis]